MESEVETKAVATIITREHAKIGETFVAQIIDMLSSGQLQIKKYGVDCDSTWQDTEAIVFRVSDGVTLEIALKRAK